MSRLPVNLADKKQWGTILNDFLRVSHNDDGTMKPTPTGGGKWLRDKAGGLAWETPTAADIGAITQTQADALYVAKGDSGGSSVSGLRLANKGQARNVKLDVTQFVGAAGSPIVFNTGYAGNEVVEPSIMYDDTAPFFADANGKNGYEWVFCQAGYFGSNDLYENPNLWVSHTGADGSWVYVVFSGGIGTPTPGYAGVLTPIVPANVQGDGHLSDPYLTRGADGTYYILFNQFLTSTGSGGTGTGGNTWATKGISAPSLAGPWSAPVTMWAEVGATTRTTSPSAFYDGTLWHIYAFDTHNSAAQVPLIHFTAQNLLETWTKLTNPTLTYPTSYSATRTWFHLNAFRVGNQHILVIMDTVVGNFGSGGNLWAVSSSDAGATWTVPTIPFLPGSFYRSTGVFVETSAGLAFDLFYGTAAFAVGRGTVSLSTPLAKYGGVRVDGVPVNTAAVGLARVPIAPYLFGDAVQRADSAVSPGTSDSGTVYTADGSGAFGVSGKQLYVLGNTNSKAIAVIAGLSDGVFTCEFSAIDTSSGAQWIIIRRVDSANFVRFGYAVTGVYQMQNIVAGAVTQTVAFTGRLPTAGDVIGLFASGSTISVYVNGIYIGQATGYANNQAGSGIGIQGSTISNQRWRNLTARPLVNGQ